MSRLEVYVRGKPEEDVLRLTLKQEEDGREIYLVAVDENGEILAGILKINIDGTLTRFPYLPKTGVPVQAESSTGRILLNE